MHESGYCHRDLKPWNIMVSSDLTSLKIIDFGYATPLENHKLEECSKYFKGKLECTVNYMAPELYLDEIKIPLDKADVFALGVILINFLTGTYPFESVYEAKSKVVRRDYLEFMSDPGSALFSSQSDELIDLVKRMLSFDAEDRLTIKEVLSLSLIHI